MKSLRLTAVIFLSFFLLVPLFGQESKKDFYFRGRFYLDWYGTAYQGSDFYHQLSSRLKAELFNRRGEGWNLLIDTRSRTRLSEEADNHFILYDARLSFEKKDIPWSFSLGQMNLYDTAGIGQLLGGMVGFKPASGFLVGGYAGLKSSVYVSRMDSDYSKFGVFARYLGSLGKRFSLSYNLVRFAGTTERKFVYLGSLYPVNKSLVFYGSMEYELASHVEASDRLSRLFLNVRFDPVELVDITAHYSSGRGLDFHRFAIETSKNPTLNDSSLERYYYSLHYGLRFSLKPIKNVRVYVSRQERENKDDNIRNHTWRFGFSTLNIFRTGLTAYGNYAANRGEISESDSYYLSVTKDIGRISASLSFSNTFNGIRFVPGDVTPQIIHMDDYKTLAADLFVPVTRTIALSLQYEFFIQESSNQHMFFVRFLWRK